MVPSLGHCQLQQVLHTQQAMNTLKANNFQEQSCSASMFGVSKKGSNKSCEQLACDKCGLVSKKYKNDDQEWHVNPV